MLFTLSTPFIVVRCTKTGTILGRFPVSFPRRRGTRRFGLNSLVSTGGHNISTEEVYLSTFVFEILFSPIPVESRNHQSFPSSGRRSRISSFAIFHPSFYIALLIRGTERFSIKSFRRCNVMLQLPSFGQANSHCLSMTILAKRKELRALNA